MSFTQCVRSDDPTSQTTMPSNQREINRTVYGTGGYKAPDWTKILTLNMTKCFKDYQRIIHIWYHILDFVQQTKSKLTMQQPYMLRIIYWQYHACWYSGNFRSLGISRNCIDPKSRYIPCPASEVSIMFFVKDCLLCQIQYIQSPRLWRIWGLIQQKWKGPRLQKFKYCSTKDVMWFLPDIFWSYIIEHHDKIQCAVCVDTSQSLPMHIITGKIECSKVLIMKFIP